jgi:hypothetical protein
MAMAPKPVTQVLANPRRYLVNTPTDARTSAKWLIFVGQVAYFRKLLA